MILDMIGDKILFIQLLTRQPTGKASVSADFGRFFQGIANRLQGFMKKRHTAGAFNGSLTNAAFPSDSTPGESLRMTQ
jgi:hypothetical protein